MTVEPAAPGKAAERWGTDAAIAAAASAGIAWHVAARLLGAGAPTAPLLVPTILGGSWLIGEILLKARRGEFGADFLAGISIVSGVLLGEYLAAALVVLMLSGGGTLENFAVGQASAVLSALARRMPSQARRITSGGPPVDVRLDEVRIGDRLLVGPHEICPVDGTVVEGHGVMDESYLTGEPYVISKVPGSEVLSGAINGDAALTIEASKLPIDSRYARIMRVMEEMAQQRPAMRRMADRLGALFTPFALAVAVAAGLLSGDPLRFLAVIVVATPCPLLIAIPVAIIGAVSLSARRSIIVRNPAVLEQLDLCQVMIFDKTGTLTYGRPALTEQHVAEGQDPEQVLTLAASVERYSKHPLAEAILSAAHQAKLPQPAASAIREPPGRGLHGIVHGTRVEITGRAKLLASRPELASRLPPVALDDALECIILLDGEYAATYRFRDEPRTDSRSFVAHLRPRHGVRRMMIVSGDREAAVRALAERVGITEVYAGQSPEQKVEIVRRETAMAPTMFLGDGINDAPALAAATIGIAFGQNSDVTSEAADAVILDTSLTRLDEFLHISRRMRQIALQSAVGGMLLSTLGMAASAAGWLTPVAGAVVQEIIDVAAVLNALRAAFPPRRLTDAFHSG